MKEFKNETYSITFNSLWSTTATLANTAAIKSYRIDWGSILPQGKYSMTFTMISEAINLTNGLNSLPCVYANLYASNNSYFCIGQDTFKTEFLGVLSIGGLLDPNTHLNFLKADTMTNQPLFFNTRPTNNEFTVTVYDNSQPLTTWLDSGAVPASISDYVLTLHFTRLE